MHGVALAVVLGGGGGVVMGAGRDRVGGGERLGARLVDAGARVRRVVLRRHAGLGLRRLHLGRGVVGQRGAEHALGVGERDPVLRALGPGQRRHDGGQVELDPLAEARLGGRVVPQPLRLGVRLDQAHLLLGATGEPQVGQRLGVDGEDRAGRAVLRAHVADGGAVGERDVADAGAVELDELADDALLAQQLGDGEHQVGGGRAGRQLAGELEADDLRDEHRDRLTQHGRLGLDAADAPAQDAQAVDHRGVRVGADEGVGVGLAAPGEDDGGQPLEVHLVDDAGLGRDDLEVLERRLAPLQELVALAVALVLQGAVQAQGLLAAEEVGDDGVVDDQLGRGQRVDPRGVAAEVGHRLAHRCQVDDARNTGEVLHEHPRGGELDLGVGLDRGVPGGDRPDRVGGGVSAVLGAQQVLQQHLEAVGQVRGALHRVEAEHLVGLPADLQLAACAEAVLTGHVCSSCSSRRAVP